jgi:tRNA (mo5U34)-methyltransferase
MARVISVEDSELRKRVAEVTWWHTIDLGNGVVTPGRDATSQKLATLHLPERFDGLEVLDIGAWDGFFSFEVERRGAKRVLAMDPMWANQNVPGFDKTGFLLAREILGSKVEDTDLDLYDLTAERVGQFDVVMFLGVLYHVKDPLGAIERVASVTRDRLILETHVDLIGSRRPMAAFYPGDELLGDTSNWWGPNPPAVTAMLKAAGFRQVETVYETPLAQRLVKSGRALTARRRGRRRRFRWGRLVVHARR